MGLMIFLYLTVVGAFAAMTPAFKEGDESHRLVYLVWYVVMVVEAVAVLTISSVWRMLSFKKTHLMERMSLLTLIVIGEGAIGVTKTVSRLMGKYGLDVEGCFLIMCIIAVLVSTEPWRGCNSGSKHTLTFSRFSYGLSISTTSPTVITEQFANRFGRSSISRFSLPSSG